MSEIAAVTQGKTLYETLANLQEAVAPHLEDEDQVDFGPVLYFIPKRVYTTSHFHLFHELQIREIAVKG